MSILFSGLLNTLLTTPTPVKSSEITGKFAYLGTMDVKKETYDFVYDDAWLTGSAYEAPFELARFSLCASMAASQVEDITDLMDQIGYEYTNNVDEVAEGLNVLAGSKITDSVYYPAQIVNGIPYFNSIAYAIGKKKIGDSTVIMVNVRGSDYGIEWGGDFNIGDGIDHEGFKIASDQVLEGIKNFIESEKITGKKKVWILGYSRAAGVSNLTGARLDQGEIEGLEPEDIYVFSFECPRTSRAEDTQDPKYDNLHCFVNPDDLIPKAPMAAWGYRTYGRNLHYPAYESDIDYPQKFEAVREIVKKITGKEIDPATNEEYTVDTFADNLAFTAVSPEGYVEHYQKALMEAMVGLFGHLKEKPEPDPEIMKALGQLVEGIVHTNPQNAQAIGRLLELKDGNLMSLNFSNPLLQDHYMELSLGWMEYLNRYDQLQHNSCRIVEINGVSDIKVLDKDKKTVVSVKGRQKTEIADGLWANFTVDGTFAIIMPENGSYTLSFGGATRNLVGYTISTFDMTLGKKSKIINYGILPLASGDFLSSTIPAGKNEPTLTKDDEMISPHSVLEGDQIVQYSIRVSAEGEGEVFGGGYFNQGSFAGFMAREKENVTFEGWYVGDKCISKESFCQIPVTEDLEIVGRFVDKK